MKFMRPLPLSLQFPDPKEMQINLTGFLNPKNARVFLGELWEHLCSAQDNIGGIPAKFVEQKKEEIKRKKVGAILCRCINCSVYGVASLWSYCY